MPGLGMRMTNNVLPVSNTVEEEPGDDLDDELRPEYDRSVLKSGVRGKHLAEYRSGTNLVLLEPDIAKAYPTAEAVNDALRRLMQSSGAA